MFIRNYFFTKAIFILLVFFSANCFCQTISGIVLDRETDKPLANTKIYLTDKNETNDTVGICYHYSTDPYKIYKLKIILETKTDSLGKFFFDSIKKGIYNIVACYTIKIIEPHFAAEGFIDKTAIDKEIEVESNKDYFSKFILDVFCEFDKTKNLKHCPICKRKDKVLPIMFGLPVFDKDGNVKFGKKYHLGGCIMDAYCNPTKHCNRCKKNF
jgi:hypothetical protein